MNIFTSNPDLYPTPPEVIDQMLMDEQVAGKVILEPSAGTGNIISRLLEAGAAEVIACEKDPNLRAILAGKCDVIADDFLTLTPEDVSHVDLVVMNPPFSQDMKHILHAFDIAPAGCTVIALCNASHIVPHTYCESTEQSRFLETIENYGYAENIGDVFKQAERRTDCHIGLVKLYKGGSGESEFDGYVFDGMTDDLSGGDTSGLMTYDFIRDIVNRYCAAVRAFDEVKAKADEINRLACFPGMKDSWDQAPIRFVAVDAKGDKLTVISHDRYKKELQKYYWRIIFKKMNLEKYATRQLREQINRFIERQKNAPFTMRNIYRVIDVIFQTNTQRMDQALLEAFDTICSFSAENSTAGEKWKTNSDYMINRKFIVPYITDGYWYNNCPREKVSVTYGGNTSLVEDIVKALCYITGQDFDTVRDLHDRVGWADVQWGQWFEWGFFRCKAFRKGTMHFEFIDEDVWAEFNRRVASLRGWELPKNTRSARGRRKSA